MSAQAIASGHRRRQDSARIGGLPPWSCTPPGVTRTVGSPCRVSTWIPGRAGPKPGTTSRPRRWPASSRAPRTRYLRSSDPTTSGRLIPWTPRNRLTPRDAPYRPEEIVSRERVIQAAAIRGAHRLDEEAVGRKTWGWSTVLEVGRMTDCRAEAVLELSGGIGIQRGTLYRPVRLVRPTTEEAVLSLAPDRLY